ncbi:MAG: histidine--tRNA ligase [Pseudomonadota bacterium]
MSEKKKIYKPKPISGFPEWLPEERMVEQRWFDQIRRVFESYGFCSIETPSVEELDVITAKGEVDKEIYTLERLHNDDSDKEARLALHFDQTVPLARYVAQHFNDLIFPFKRYQMQRVWRGERPQMGRMREFYQCDIDVINVDNLPIHFDAEVAAICYEALEALDIGRVQLRISNRKIVMGYVESLGMEDAVPVTRIIDKIEKIGEDEVTKQLKSDCGLSDEQASDLIVLTKTEDVTSIDAKNDQMREGIEELSFVLDQLKHLPEYAVKADLTIIRGLDYYTGTVYETQLLDVPEFTGSVCSGGRYDDLAGQYINKHLPGVGISIGFSRLFDVMRQTHPDKLGIGPKSPADILMVLPNEDMRATAADAARSLRANGYKVEMYHAPQKIGKQLAYAEKKGIPYVWFPPFEDGSDHEVKNMASGEQVSADPDSWSTA